MGKKKEKSALGNMNSTFLETDSLHLTCPQDGVLSKKPKKHKCKKSNKKDKYSDKEVDSSKTCEIIGTYSLMEDQEVLVDETEVEDFQLDPVSGMKLIIKTPDTFAEKSLKSLPKNKTEKNKASNNSKKSSKKKDGSKGEEDTDSEEERWLDAIESGKLEEVDDELKRIKNPRLMTARQRALMEKKDGVDDGLVTIPAEPLLALPTGFKEKVLTEEMLAKKAIKSKRRREQAIEKREEDKKKTVDRLLKKQDSKLSRSSRTKGLKKSVPLLTYVNNREGVFLSFPLGVEAPPISPLTERNAVKPVVCGGDGCLNLKKYSCSKTGVPLCSLECYKRNLEKSTTSAMPK